jgi:hypothetical protein
VIRLTSQLSPEEVRTLTNRFRGICVPGGGIAVTAAMDAETDDADVIHLPRLVMDFNRRDFSKLRSLVDAINDFWLLAAASFTSSTRPLPSEFNDLTLAAAFSYMFRDAAWWVSSHARRPSAALLTAFHDRATAESIRFFVSEGVIG